MPKLTSIAELRQLRRPGSERDQDTPGDWYHNYRWDGACGIAAVRVRQCGRSSKSWLSER